MELLQLCTQLEIQQVHIVPTAFQSEMPKASRIQNTEVPSYNLWLWNENAGHECCYPGRTLSTHKWQQIYPTIIYLSSPFPEASKLSSLPPPSVMLCRSIDVHCSCWAARRGGGGSKVGGGKTLTGLATTILRSNTLLRQTSISHNPLSPWAVRPQQKPTR